MKSAISLKFVIAFHRWDDEINNIYISFRSDIKLMCYLQYSWSNTPKPMPSNKPDIKYTSLGTLDPMKLEV